MDLEQVINLNLFRADVLFENHYADMDLTAKEKRHNLGW
jgi:hypothetical protein